MHTTKVSGVSHPSEHGIHHRLRCPFVNLRTKGVTLHVVQGPIQKQTCIAGVKILQCDTSVWEEPWSKT